MSDRMLDEAILRTWDGGRRRDQPSHEEPGRGPSEGAYVITDGDLAEAIGSAPGNGPDEAPSGADGARLAMLERLLAAPASRFRPWTRGDDAMIGRLKALGAAAPNFAEATALVLRAAHLSRATGAPMRLCSIVLCGPPGVGKTYYARRLGDALGTPVTTLAGILITERGTITGLGPIWKAPRMGLVAKALLSGRTSIPLVYIDEVEKMVGLLPEDRPLDALLPLLEAETARSFVDDYLGVPARADLIAWVMTANEVGTLGAPLRDRVVVIDVPDLTRAERRRMARRIFDEANLDHGESFGRIGPKAVDALSGLRTRRIKAVLAQAMGHAAAAGRMTVTARDVEKSIRLVAPEPKGGSIGFRLSGR